MKWVLILWMAAANGGLKFTKVNGLPSQESCERLASKVASNYQGYTCEPSGSGGEKK